MMAGVMAGGRPLAPVVSTPAHLYWRLNITANNYGYSTSAAEIEMRATVGGADQCNGGVVTASSGSATMAAAFDNNPATAWESGSEGSWWIQYEFPSPVSVGELMLQCKADSYNSIARNFSLQYSDDAVTWGTLFSVINQNTWTSAEKRYFTP